MKYVNDPISKPPLTLAILAERLESGETTSLQLVEEAFQRYEAAGDKHLFTLMLRDQALRQAAEIDALRARSEHPSSFAGIPITIKDLFDLENEVTTAGSKVLASSPAAKTTAPAISNLIAAGFVVLGRVNMTEFAYSGLGLNPHYGTPVNPWSGDDELIPGGSSSGSAVSVASGLVAASIGTDTGGSVRIPASLCHLTGFKPGSESIDKQGVIPLALTLDTVGPLCNSVACCDVLYQLMSGVAINDLKRQIPQVSSLSVAGMRVLAPSNVVYEGADESVVSRTEAALALLERHGAEVDRKSLALLDDILRTGVQGIIAGFESAQWHQQHMLDKADSYDPRVINRLVFGAALDEETYQQALQQVASFRARFTTLMDGFDVVVWPTTAVTAPRFADLQEDDDYSRTNLLLLRNTALGNVLNMASVNLPMTVHLEGADYLPAGLMVSRPAGDEIRTLEYASAIEALASEVGI